MCQKVGYSRFIMRDSANIRIEVSGIEEHYKELRKIEYTNERRRMSVVVRNKDTDQVTIFTKGADTAIVDLLATRGQFENDTIENSDVFAADGLRTLLLAKRELTADEVARVNELTPEELERDLILLGGTGLEDRLQEQVKECVEDFMQAKIKIWMVTGDKDATAYSVGIASGIVDEER